MASTRGRLEGRITVPAGGWTATVGAGTATIAAGNYYPGELLTAVGTAFATAAGTTCTATVSRGESGTGLVTLTFGSSKAVTWVSTDLRDVLGFAASMVAATSHVGTKQMRGLWLPGCAYKAPDAVSASWSGWREGDARSAANAAGYTWTLFGSTKVVNELSWFAVARAKTWIGNESTVNQSFERFATDCIWGEPTWGNAGGPILFYPDADATVYVTYMVPDARVIRPAPTHDGWAGGPWRIALPRLVVVPGTGGTVWTLPDDATEWAATFPSITTPTAIWNMQDTSSPAVDSVGGFNLTASTFGGVVNFAQTDSGLSRSAVQPFSASAYLRGSSTSVLDITTGSFSIFFRFLVDATEAGTSGHYLWRKKSSSAGTNGWGIKFSGAGGAIQIILDSPASTQTSATVSANFIDSAWHWMLAVIDRGGGNLYLYSDLGNASADISAHAGGSLTNATYFGTGDVNGNGNAGTKVAFSYACAWSGTAISSTEFDTLRDA